MRFVNSTVALSPKIFSKSSINVFKERFPTYNFIDIIIYLFPNFGNFKRSVESDFSLGFFMPADEWASDT